MSALKPEDDPLDAPRVACGCEVAPRPLRVLVIEDDEDIRSTLRDILELGGHEVEVASDGLEGVEMLLRRLPDVALIDIGLPGLDGYQVARLLRRQLAQRAERPPRLVAMTGYGLPEDRRRALEAGFDDHVVKPVHPDALYRKLV
jgi:CheY-like chemotaxis protein